MNRNPHDANKGMNTRTYMMWVVASLVLLFVVLLGLIAAKRVKAVPKAVAPNPMKSQVDSVAGPLVSAISSVSDADGVAYVWLS